MYETCIAFAQAVVIETEPGERTRPQGVNKNISGNQKLVKYLLVAIKLEIEHETTFVPVYIEECRAHPAITERRDIAEDVSCRRFDFDNVRAHIAQDLGGVWSHDDAG